MSEKDGGFPSAYSSFAVSVDSRNAERPIYSTPPSSDINNSGILRQGRGTTSPYNRPLSHEKRRSLSPRSQDRLDTGRGGKQPGVVRFSKDTIHEYDHHVPSSSSLHHRRSSTAAFLEYIRTHLPESHNRASIAITPKRAVMLFAIVFSATYLALGIMPMLASYTGIGGPVTVVIKRGDGYYGNSHIFRGGENLADPHLAGDEHHQYLGHHAAAKGAQVHDPSSDDQHDNEHIVAVRGSNGRANGKQRTLKTSTLAEEATLKEIKVARAKAKAEALARAQLLAEEDIEDDDDDAEMNAAIEYVKPVPELPKIKDEVPRKRPLMPLKKLAEKVKLDRQAREKAAADKEEMEAEVEKEAAKTAPLSDAHESAAIIPEPQQEQEEEEQEDDNSELEGIIAKLRQEALDRRLRKIHAAQKDVKQSHFDNVPLPKKRVEVRDGSNVDDESRIRRPGIVKSRKVSTKEE